jgi:uncharacterized membrane protein
MTATARRDASASRSTAVAKSAAAWLGWGLVGLLAIGFIDKYVAHYLVRFDAGELADYWPRRWGFLLHILCGSGALLLGLAQFWTGLRRRWPVVHRWTGRAYLGCVGLGMIAGYYLAATTTFGPSFGLGLAGLATAWGATTGVAWYAIRKRAVELHRSWMIRSYVVTFAFVVFRLCDEYLPTKNLRPIGEREVTSAWLCWALPLLVTIVIQGLLEIRRRARSRVA